MGIWLDVARGAAGANVLLLLGLGWVWLRGYREHGASHTLGLLVFAGFLLVENLVWLYLYFLRADYVGWFAGTSGELQAAIAFLCGFELLALVFLARITLQ
ncbi:MAG: hypothetical protein ABEJ74_03860 [Haloferacaceae archaeon]